MARGLPRARRGQLDGEGEVSWECSVRVGIPEGVPGCSGVLGGVEGVLERIYGGYGMGSESGNATWLVAQKLCE